MAAQHTKFFLIYGYSLYYFFPTVSVFFEKVRNNEKLGKKMRLLSGHTVFKSFAGLSLGR